MENQCKQCMHCIMSKKEIKYPTTFKGEKRIVYECGLNFEEQIIGDGGYILDINQLACDKFVTLEEEKEKGLQRRLEAKGW